MKTLADYLFWEEPGIQLYCGDCREVLPLLRCQNTSVCLEACDGRCAGVDFIFTDPPFGLTVNDDDLIARWEAVLGRGAPGPPRPIANAGPEADELIRWAFAEFADLLVEGGCCCCCGGGGGPQPIFARWSLWMDGPLEFKQMVVWDKGPMGMGWHYRRSYETVLVAQKRGRPGRWYDETGRVENIIRHIPRTIPQAQDHPTPKPEALAAHFIRLHTLPGHLVLDPFMGGGSTIRAAKDLGRRAIGVEIEPRWCELAVKRLRQGVLPL